MVAAVINKVHDHLPVGGGPWLSVQSPVFNHPRQIARTEPCDEGSNVAFERYPTIANSVNSPQVCLVHARSRGLALPAVIPDPLGRLHVKERGEHRAEGAAQIP